LTSGAFLTGFLFAPTPGLSVNVPGDHLLPQGTRDGYDATLKVSGPLTSARPISVRNVAKGGARAATFVEDWYNRIHVLPQVIDFGAVSGGATRTASLWNAYLTPTTIGSTTRNRDANLALGGAVPTTVLEPLQVIDLIISPEEEGPATLDTVFTFGFSGRGDSPSLTVLGRRARLWPFPPNWSEAVDVGMEFRTDIVVSRDGHEQRRALRQTARRQIGYGMVLEQADMRTLDRVLSKWQGRPWLLPDPTRSVVCPDGAPPGADQIQIDRVPGWMTAGQTLVLDGGIVMIVDEVDGLTLTLDAPLTETLRAGAEVRPAMSGRLAGTLTARHLTNGASRMSFNFSIEPGSEAANRGAPGYLVHDGREVFATRPNWAAGVDSSYAWETESIDYGFGRTATYNPLAFGTMTRRADFVRQGVEQTEELEQFFNRQVGQVGEFLMPTWLDDLPPQFDLVEGVSHIRVAGTDVYQAYVDDLTHKALAVMTTDGRMMFRRVTGITVVTDVDGEASILSIDRPWMTDLSIDEILMVSWLPVMRLASDQMTFEWLTDSVAQTTLSMQTLEALPAEDPIADYDGAAMWVLEVWGASTALPLFDSLDYLVNVRYPGITT